MNLYLKQHIFSWGDKFTVYSQDGSDCFYVKGEVFSWGKKLHILGLDGGELAFIQQKVFSFLPKYYITAHGYDIAEVVKEFTFFRQQYSVNGLGWNVSGDFWAHEYCITSGNQNIVQVSKQWFTFGDAYQINIATGVDPVVALAVVLVIDACIEAQRNNS